MTIPLLPTLPASTFTPIVRSLQLSDEAQMQTFAAALAARVQEQRCQNLLIYLEGDLGAGKTTFTRYFLTALGVTGRIKSPTYSVVETYELNINGKTQRACHFDFYRFQDESEWEEAGFRDLFAEAGIKLVEWPSKAGGLLPTPDLVIKIQIDGNFTTDFENKSLRMVDLKCFSDIGLHIIP